jgi:hypothetical protein
MGKLAQNFASLIMSDQDLVSNRIGMHDAIAISWSFSFYIRAIA